MGHLDRCNEFKLEEVSEKFNFFEFLASSSLDSYIHKTELLKTFLLKL